jgi:hypothetical protein
VLAVQQAYRFEVDVEQPGQRREECHRRAVPGADAVLGGGAVEGVALDAVGEPGVGRVAGRPRGTRVLLQERLGDNLSSNWNGTLKR